jgi:hypothetical protein
MIYLEQQLTKLQASNGIVSRALAEHAGAGLSLRAVVALQALAQAHETAVSHLNTLISEEWHTAGLPPPRQLVLAVVAHQGPVKPWYMPEILFYDDFPGRWSRLNQYLHPTERVTHWRPLPSYPTEET